MSSWDRYDALPEDEKECRNLIYAMLNAHGRGSVDEADMRIMDFVEFLFEKGVFDD